MNYQDFLNELKSNKDCNFIGLAVTVHHASSIDATMAYLEDNGFKLHGYVLMLPHGATGKIVKRDKFVYKNDNIKYINYEQTFKLKTVVDIIVRRLFPFIKNLFYKESYKKDFFIASPQLQYFWIYDLNKIFPDRNFKLIMLEDGDGSYADHFEDSLNFMKRAQDNLHSLGYYLAYIKFCIYYFFEFINYKILSKKRKLLMSTIFLKDTKDGKYRLIRNVKMSKYYEEVFSQLGCCISKDKLKVFENAALINTQPLNSNNITDGIVDFEAYRKVIEILNSLKIPVVIKPHRRELDYKKYEKFKCNVYNDNTCSQEAILANLEYKPKCIISIFSSTLLNAHGIYGIPVISLAKIILKEKINDVFVQQLKDFINRYKDLFFFPENYKELEDYLSKLK